MTDTQARAIVTTLSSDGSVPTTIASAHYDGGAETSAIRPVGDRGRAIASEAGVPASTSPPPAVPGGGCGQNACIIFGFDKIDGVPRASAIEPLLEQK